MQPAIGLGARIVPGIEDRRDGAPELLARILRKWRAVFALDRGLVVGDDFAPRLFVEIGVAANPLRFLKFSRMSSNAP